MISFSSLLKFAPVTQNTLSELFEVKMPRRTSVRSCIALLALLLAITPMIETTSNPDLAAQQLLQTPIPYYFPNFALGNSLDLFPMQTCNGTVLEEVTIDRLQKAMSKGELTSTELAICYWQRIRQVDSYTKYVFSSVNSSSPIERLVNRQQVQLRL